MRDLREVHQQVLAAIPDPVLREQLNEACRSILQTFNYCAPEMLGLMWREWGLRLEWVLGHDAEARPWIRNVQRIVSGSADD